MRGAVLLSWLLVGGSLVSAGEPSATDWVATIKRDADAAIAAQAKRPRVMLTSMTTICLNLSALEERYGGHATGFPKGCQEILGGSEVNWDGSTQKGPKTSLTFARVTYQGKEVFIHADSIMMEKRPTEPFSLRGYKLGMTLNEAKLTKHPDHPSAVLLCSNDKQVEVLLGPLRDMDAEGGAFQCAHWQPGSPGPAANMIVANVETQPKFIFAPDATGSLRLYKIVVLTSDRHWGSFDEALIGRFGAPLDRQYDHLSWGIRSDTVLNARKFAGMAQLEFRHVVLHNLVYQRWKAPPKHPTNKL